MASRKLRSQRGTREASVAKSMNKSGAALCDGGSAEAAPVFSARAAVVEVFISLALRLTAGTSRRALNQLKALEMG
jgi:hypothetical protein